jgi:hypothetical protein
MNELENAETWTDNEWNKFEEWLKGMLFVSTVTITFTKKDGTERVMKCTLQPELLPKVEIKEDKQPRKKSTDVLSVFDLEMNNWRSFTLKSVKKVHITIGEENDSV